MAVTLGKSIQILRQAKGLSQGELAKIASLSVPYLSLIEADKRHPSMPVLERMSASLGVPALFLIRQSMSTANASVLGAESDAETGIQSAINGLVELEKHLKVLVSGTKPDESIQQDNS
ncbi:MAG: helix-turn-helix transcriptional regulator [Planctomycetaceae bacterium]